MSLVFRTRNYVTQYYRCISQVAIFVRNGIISLTTSSDSTIDDNVILSWRTVYRILQCFVQHHLEEDVWQHLYRYIHRLKRRRGKLCENKIKSNNLGTVKLHGLLLRVIVIIYWQMRLQWVKKKS